MILVFIQPNKKLEHPFVPSLEKRIRITFEIAANSFSSRFCFYTLSFVFLHNLKEAILLFRPQEYTVNPGFCYITHH
jgi:hypothetical protein